jgi:hypothetical protein
MVVSLGHLIRLQCYITTLLLSFSDLVFFNSIKHPFHPSRPACR